MRPAAVVPRLLFLIGVVAVISGEVLSFPADVPRANLRWKTNSITISISDSLINRNSSIKYGSDTLGALQRSMNAWESVADISFKRVFTRDQSVSPSGQSGDGISLITIAQTPENVLLFAHGADDASAKTRVFYDRTGSITEADIVLNPFLQFSTDGTGTIDLESALTHEIGHLLGLDHSAVLGAAMYENFGRNGSSGTRDLNSRRLGDQDIAAIRALYGPRDDDTCCGRIDGTLLVSPASSTGLFVWAEDTDTGRVMAEGVVNGFGRFSLGGLSAGKYRLFAEDGGRAEKISSAQLLGDFEVEKDTVTTVSRRVRLVSSGFDLRYVGLNGIISSLAIAIQPGQSSSVFIGGNGINENQVSVASDSPFIKVLRGTVTVQAYGGGITVLNVEIRVSEATPPGEYSLFAETDGGYRRYLVGGLVVSAQR